MKLYRGVWLLSKVPWQWTDAYIFLHMITQTKTKTSITIIYIYILYMNYIHFLICKEYNFRKI